MLIPNVSDPRWVGLVTGKVKPQLEYLAVKIFLVKASMATTRDPSPTNIKQHISELRALLDKNAKMPAVQNDLQKIFG